MYLSVSVEIRVRLIGLNITAMSIDGLRGEKSWSGLGNTRLSRVERLYLPIYQIDRLVTDVTAMMCGGMTSDARRRHA